MSLSVVIPAFNEAEAVSFVLTRLQDRLTLMFQKDLISDYEVIVVDDGSTDRTGHELKAFDHVRRVHLSQRSGYGAALKAGFMKSTGDVIAFFDMDGTYDPEDLESMVSQLLTNDHDVVHGVRLSGSNRMPWTRKLGNFFYAALTSFLFRRQIRDVCTGFRIFRRELLPSLLSLECSDLSFSLSMTLLTLEMNLSYGEVPIRYHVRVGYSKLNLVVDGFSFLFKILGHYFNPKLELSR